jgi:hypothetical protein
MLSITAGSSRNEGPVPRPSHPRIAATVAAMPPSGSTHATPFLVWATEPTATPRELTTRFPTSSSVTVTFGGIVPTRGRTAKSRASLRLRGRRRDPLAPAVTDRSSSRSCHCESVWCARQSRHTSVDSSAPARRTGLMTAHYGRATGPVSPRHRHVQRLSVARSPRPRRCVLRSVVRRRRPPATCREPATGESDAPGTRSFESGVCSCRHDRTTDSAVAGDVLGMICTAR